VSCEARRAVRMVTSRMTSLRLLALTGFALLLAASPLRAEPPIYHGVLEIRPAGGGIDPSSGEIGLNVKSWTFRLDPGSDGLYPATEPVVFALGDTEQFLLPAGALVPNRKGNRFSYTNPNKKLARGIKMFRVVLGKDGLWRVKFKVAGVQAARLTFEFPVCEKMAVIGRRLLRHPSDATRRIRGKAREAARRLRRHRRLALALTSARGR
jgi:hypothetical protein